MKIRSKNQKVTRFIFVFCTFLFVMIGYQATGQDKKILVYDTFHGQNAAKGNVFNTLLPSDSSAIIEIDTTEITGASLSGKYGLILFSPTKTFLTSEKDAIIRYLQTGGSLLLIFDEERRMSLSLVGVNDIIVPFGIELTDDVLARHNCGAIAEKSEVCAGKRELPYSGGRSINGGKVISRVYDDGDYIHCSYLKLPRGGKIIVMSDGMAALLLGRPDGERFNGTGPADSKYWGKDSKIFMEEILDFLLKE